MSNGGTLVVGGCLALGHREIGRLAGEQGGEEARQLAEAEKKEIPKGEKPAVPAASAEPKTEAEKPEESPDPVPGAFLREGV